MPLAIALTDAFGFSDWELNSSLGVYHGRVYESLWEHALAEPLNLSEVTNGYEVSMVIEISRIVVHTMIVRHPSGQSYNAVNCRHSFFVLNKVIRPENFVPNSPDLEYFMRRNSFFKG